MFFSRKRNRLFWALLSVAMIAGNLADSMAVYAAGTRILKNRDRSVLEESGTNDTLPTESSYVNDTPLRLQVSKIKTAKGAHEGISPQKTEAAQADTITYQLSGRVEGSEAELMGKYGSCGTCLFAVRGLSGIWVFEWNSGIPFGPESPEVG